MIDLLKTLTRPVLAAALLLIGVSSPSMASAAAVSLPELPYAHDALSSAIDENTMRIHHGRHHQRYVNNLNRVIEADASPQGQSLQSLPANASTRSSAIHNNGGDHWNHSLFWQSMAKAAETGTLSATLMAVIERDFDSMDDFKNPVSYDRSRSICLRMELVDRQCRRQTASHIDGQSGQSFDGCRGRAQHAVTG
jgi:hypothetical protein